MSQIDVVDEQILSELQTNGRLTMKALAERVGLSSPAMIERVRRLEERGVITGYRAVVAPASIGRPIAALVSARVERDQAEAFVAAASTEAGVVECHRVTGEFSYLVRVHVPDMAALEKLSDKLAESGARCTIQIILSSPVEWRELTTPEGTVPQRARQTRRRRNGNGNGNGNATEPKRSPGRPRTRTDDLA